MALPTNRNSFKEFCLRKLGKGANDIDVTDQQVEDRIDECIGRFQDFHGEGTEQVYIARKLSASTLILTSVSGTFEANETIVGSTSGGKGSITEVVNSTTLSFQKLLSTNVDTVLVSGEIITGSTSGATATISSITLGDIDNGYITVPDTVIGVTNIIPNKNFYSGSGDFNPAREVFYSYLYSNMMPEGNLTQYYIAKSYQSTIENLMSDQISYNFNSITKKLHILADWNDLQINSYLVYEAEKIIDPEVYSNFWKDEFFIRYATACIKRQWGENLSKYSNVELLSGSNINADGILSDAKEQLEILERELDEKYQEPIGFIIG